MSEQRHTPEPWSMKTRRNPSVSDHYAVGSDGIGLGDMMFREREVIDANQERAVACVNAMAGVTDPSALRRSHEELVKACEQTLESMRNHNHARAAPIDDECDCGCRCRYDFGEDCGGTFDLLRDALASARALTQPARTLGVTEADTRPEDERHLPEGVEIVQKHQAGGKWAIETDTHYWAYDSWEQRELKTEKFAEYPSRPDALRATHSPAFTPPPGKGESC